MRDHDKNGVRRKQLIELMQEGRIQDDDVESALFISEVYPSGASWRRTLDVSMLAIGCLALAMALIFFVAANWQHIERFGKFALIETCILIPIICYWRFHSHPYYSKAALVVATLATGGLMAFFGQTYQTGADTWQLFFNWAILVIPWVWIARFSILTLFWLALLNLSVKFYFTSGQLIQLSTLNNYLIWMWATLSLNCLALIIWQSLALRNPSWRDWPVQVLVYAVLLQSTVLAIDGLFRGGYYWINIAVWAALISVGFIVYRIKLLNIANLVAGCLSVVVVGNAIVIKLTPINLLSDFMLINALLVLAMGYAAVVWLKAIAHEHSHE